MALLSDNNHNPNPCPPDYIGGATSCLLFVHSVLCSICKEMTVTLTELVHAWLLSRLGAL
jgi:hypothetical protein